MRKLSSIASSQAPGLSEFQIAWLQKQSQMLGIPCDRLLGTILNEWLSEHPQMLQGRPGNDSIVRRALDDFIHRHSAEFLPCDLV
jgi:hypothetical protein